MFILAYFVLILIFVIKLWKKATFENKVIQVLDHVQASVGLQYQWGNIMND